MGKQMREIMEFSFALNSDRETHVHQDVEILYLLRGTAQILINEESYMLKKGDYILVNANKRHSIKNLEVTTLFARFVIDYSMMTEYLGTNQLLFWCNTVSDKDEAYHSLRVIFDRILTLFFEGEQEEQFRLRSLFYEVIYLLVSHFMIKTDDIRVQRLGFTNDTRVFEIQNYVQANYQKQLSLNELAQKLYLTPAYLSKYIRKQFGLSFLDYLNNVRLFHALDELLYTDKKVTRIAVDNGFPATASFNKAFKDCFDLTPSEYRRKYSGKSAPREGRTGSLNELEIEDIKRFLDKSRENPEISHGKQTELFTAHGDKWESLKKPWSHIINIGEAALLLRSDVQEHIKMLKEELGFTQVRIWNIFSLIIYQNAQGYLNYNKLDRILDFLTENGLSPFIELGFKPKIVIKAADEFLINQESEILFHSLMEYERALNELAAHMVNRYGLETVETWNFELWHDNRLKIEEEDGWYFPIFDAGYSVLKRISKKIKIGGAGIVLGYESHLYEAVFSAWKKRAIWPDFLSVYSYGYVMIPQDGVLYGKKSLDSQYTLNQLDVLKQTLNQLGFNDRQIYVSEWNFTISNRNALNDSCWKAAYLVKNCIDAEGKIDLLACWHGTDLISEHYDTEAVLNGDSGLLTKEGICKPAFYAFRFLSRMQPRLLGRNFHAMVTANGRGNYAIVCHNYKKLTYQYATKEEDKLDLDQMESYYEDNLSLRLQFRIDEAEDGEYLVKSHYLNQSNGSVQDLWKEMGYQKNLSGEEMTYMKQMGNAHMEMQRVTVKDGVLELETVLMPHEIRLLEIKYQY